MGDTLHADIRFSIVPEAVLDADISDRAVRIYALLARYADSETGKCFPSRETLAKRAGCHVRSVGRAIDELINIGAIEKHQRKDDKSWQSNLYVVKRVVNAPSGGRAPTPEGRASVSPPSGTGVPLTRTKELEPLNDMFTQFWEIYPLKKDKRPAKRAFENALKRVDFQTLLNAAQSYRDDPNRTDGFTKYPATWLNADAWENGPEVARGKPTPLQVGTELHRKYKQQEDAGLDFLPNMKGIEE